MNVELAVGQDANEAVEPVRAAGVERAADADADDLAAIALAGQLLLLLPFEQLAALGQCVLEVGAGQLALAVVAFEAVVVGGIDAPDRKPVDA